jgi:hypothetical protein
MGRDSVIRCTFCDTTARYSLTTTRGTLLGGDRTLYYCEWHRILYTLRW